MLRFLCTVLWLASLLSAQRVELANYTPYPFAGWHRTTIDVPVPFQAGAVGENRFVVGRSLGRSAKVLDVWARLPAGSRRTIDLAASVARPFQLLPLPVDLQATFGGGATVSGQTMRLVSVAADGAAWTAHWAARVGPMLHVDLWTVWYPDNPGLAHGECVVTASNPAVADVVCTAPSVTIGFGDSIASVVGGAIGEVVPAGTRLGDGQAIAKPLTFLWPRMLTAPDAWGSARAKSTFGISAVGITRLWPDGNPSYPDGWSARAWANPLVGEAWRRLHTMEGPVVGPATNSGDTGSQWDQVFVGGEPMLRDGVGSEMLFYASALQMLKRPCHFLEADGSFVDQRWHPELVVWSGRPHWHRGVSPDQLGKARAAVGEDSFGWMGPDREHWLYNVVMAASRYTGSPTLQWELRQQAHLFLLQETIDPRLSTSHAGAARAGGWTGIIAAHLFENLEDRVLAERVAARWRERVLRVYVPEYGTTAGNIWALYVDDGRVGPGPWWLAWHQSIGAYGIDLACQVMGPPEGRALALAGAKACVDHGWIQFPGAPRFRAMGNIPWTHLGKPASEPYQPVPVEWWTPATIGPDWWETTWAQPAVAVVLKHEPNHAKARAVAAQMKAAVAGARQSWLPPGRW